MSNVNVADLMSEALVTVAPGDTLEAAQAHMREHVVSALPVVDAEGALAGIVTATDLLRARDPQATVAHVMSEHVYTVPPYVDVHIAARVMRNHRLHHVVVTDGGRPTGVLSAYDLLRLVEQHRYVAKPAPTSSPKRGKRGKAEKALSEATAAESPQDRSRRRLEDLLTHLTRRGAAVERDRSRAAAPLEADFAEQAVTRENDEVLDALAREGREQLARVGEALEALDQGSYGTCADCQATIPPERLEALPYAVTCVACAKEREAAAAG